MKRYQLVIALGMVWAACALFLTACSSTGAHTARTEPSGAKLWAQNCIRCHNSRSPTSYSEAQWDVTMLHMRIRANLTAEQYTAILNFIKTAD